jgi:hypothetical protein
MKMEYIKTNKLPLLAQGVSGKASRIYNALKQSVDAQINKRARPSTMSVYTKKLHNYNLHNKSTWLGFSGYLTAWNL